MDISFLKSFDYWDFRKNIKGLSQKYPFISVDSIGKSVMGKEIFALTLGKADECALFVGGIHGPDSFSSGLLAAFFEELCDAVESDGAIEGLKVRKALWGRALTIIPCLNPDGCEIASKGKAGCGNRLEEIKNISGFDFKKFSTNARGVDIDLNFSGRSALSEPESHALSVFVKEHNIRHSLVFGSGNGELITPGGEKIPARSSRMTEIMTATTGYNISFNKNDRRREGFMDWFCGEFFKPAFKILPTVPEQMKESDYIKVYKNLRELMMLTSIM